VYDEELAMIKTELVEDLRAKFKALQEAIWEGRAQWPQVQKWMGQFRESTDLQADEQVQMLFLASHFMYFGMPQIRALLRSLFRDLYQYKIIEHVRRSNSDTRDRQFIDDQFRQRLMATRFLGVGNPSESGSHLLYYFRQENRLGKQYFINSHEIFSRVGQRGSIKSTIRDSSIAQYVFIDDLCGSGTQATAYTRDLVQPLKDVNPDIRISYYTLFATTFGLSEVRKLKSFDEVAAVVELDESFKCFSPNSRIYKNQQFPFSKDKAEATARQYGATLVPTNPLGWRDGQLLIGFCHNTPDNTLPIVWFDEPGGTPWTPLFRRYPKQYGWET
jgi:hypothetical protein